MLTNPLHIVPDMTVENVKGKEIEFLGIKYVVGEKIGEGKDRIVFNLHPNNISEPPSKYVIKIYKGKVFDDISDAKRSLDAYEQELKVLERKFAETHLVEVSGGFVEIQERLDGINIGDFIGIIDAPCYKQAKEPPGRNLEKL